MRRLGHFGFDNVAMAESLTFYTDLLGFRLSDILDFNRVARDKKTIEGLGDDERLQHAALWTPTIMLSRYSRAAYAKH